MVHSLYSKNAKLTNYFKKHLVRRDKNSIFADMDTSTCTQLLERHGIKPTSNRILVLKALAAEEHPSSLGDLERMMLSLDKSSVFRCLVTFRDHHLVHAIDDGEGGVKYELCHSHAADGHDDDQHVHFFCERCHRLFCMEGTPAPAVSLPEGFVTLSVNYMVKGVCPDCARKKGQRP